MVTFDDELGLLDLLRPRWEQIREGAWLDATAEHTYLGASAPLPVVELRARQIHTLVVQPKVLLARIRGMLFDTNRTFLLPSALEHLPRLTALYADHPGSTLLLTGHTDTTGEPDTNDPLSLERATSVAAFLRDDAAAWLRWYEPSVPQEKRWGAYEDGTMLTAVLGRAGEEIEGSPLLHFQRTRGLAADGIAGPITREALVTEYMALEGTTLPEGVELQLYGCGERFPLSEGGDEALDRRVELFFFQGDLGVLPAVEHDQAYEEWRRRATQTIDLHAGTQVHSIILDDPLFGVAAQITVEATDSAGNQMTLLTDAEGRLPIEPSAGDFIDLRYTWGGRGTQRRVFTAVDDVASPDGAWQRLVHLGYTQILEPERQPSSADALEDAMLLFQLDFGLEPTAQLDHETPLALLRVHDQDLRPWAERDWELPDEPDPDAPTPKQEVS